MENLVPGTKFREILRTRLKEKMQTNPSYSLRAFAKNLGISPSGLSMMMNGKTPITLSSISKIGMKLNFSHQEIEDLQMSLLTEKNFTVMKVKDFEVIDSDRFELIKEWYHYGILNLMRTKGFQQKPAWIAKRLGITITDVQSAVERLEKVGLIKIENGVWVDISSKFTSHTNNKQYSEAAKKNQIQLFTKALDCIEKVDFTNRNHTGTTIAISVKDLDRAKERITKFRKQFMAEFDREMNADEVYHISVALFPLTSNG